MARVLTLDNVNVDGKTVIVRVDINSPMAPATNTFLDDTRIKAIVPTLNRLSKAKVIILAHQSRPGKDDFTSTLGHSRELGRLLGRQIKWVDDIYGSKAMDAIEQLQDGQILMLNNVRMDEQEISVSGDFATLSKTKMVQVLSGIADIFVNDAFACAHRSTASITGFTHEIPCVAGELMGYEIRKLDYALENPQRPCLAILGGIKVDDSVTVADNMLRHGIADDVWVTGGVANMMVELSGIDIGDLNHNFLVNELGDNYHSTVETAKSLLNDFPDNIHLPVDLAANIEDNRVDLFLEDLPVEAPLIDLGIQSTMAISAAIKNAGTVILNGPAGIFELPDFSLGTIEILNACAETDGYAVMGGGHTATLVMKYGLASKMGHVSTGGGASLDYIAGRTLPGIASLEASAKQFAVEITKPVDHQ
jgi:phosphoglycerate kinase